MKSTLLTVAAFVVLGACATPPQAPAPKAKSGIENPRLSAKAVLREDPDLACADPATTFDATLARRAAPDSLAETFDAVANCRRDAARGLVRAHAEGRLSAAQAAARLIGLRGATRRDVARLRAAVFNRQGANALQTRLAQAETQQDDLVLGAELGS